MKNSLFLGIFALSFSMWSNDAVADGVLAAPASGGGQYGANRRIRTYDSGYTAVKGNFKLPTYKIPGSPVAPLATTDTNPYDARPSFYLGASRGGDVYDEDTGEALGLFEVDAGFAYENYRPLQSGVGPVQAGWSIFIRTTSPPNTPQGGAFVSPAGAWRCGPGTPNANVTDVELMWTFYKRSVLDGEGYGGYLIANVRGSNGNPLPLASQPQDKNGSGVRIRATYDGQQSPGSYTITRAINAMRVKRVVAITQADKPRHLQFPVATGGGVYQEDGSYMRGLSFTQGQVSQQDPAPGGFNYNYTPSQWFDWTTFVTDNGDNQAQSTGYYPGGSDKTVLSYQLVPPFAPDPGVPLLIETGKAPGSLPIFSFPGIPQPQWGDVISSRYASENVDINLRSYIPVGGGLVSPSGITPDID